MKLLIITQKVDLRDPILGFFHGWIVEFAKHFESITVICLGKGDYDLPSNVKVLSLGKEENRSRPSYVLRFYSYICRERKNYDAVFVHMNQEYVILGWKIWKLLGKRITLWRNHGKGSLLTRLAVSLSDKVFCTSLQSFTARFKKTVIMPVGIDTGLFKPTDNIRKISRSVLFLGRISPIKNVDNLIEALGILKNRGNKFSADIYGDALPRDAGYLEELKSRARGLALEGDLNFNNAVPNGQTPQIYNNHEISVNLTASGSLDKTIFEAMACGCLPLFSNEALSGKLDPRLCFKENDIPDLAEKIEALFHLDGPEKDKLMGDCLEFVRSRHSLSALAKALGDAIQSIK